MGEIYVKWERRDEDTYLSIVIPFGMTAVVTLPEGNRELNAGTYCFQF